MAYIGQEPGQGVAQRSIFTAVAVTDTVTADDNSLPLNYTVGQVSVYLNGVKQVVGDDVVASNGSTLVFDDDYAIGDVIEVIALSAFSPADTVPATGGTFSGQVTLPSPVINTGVSGSAILDSDAMSGVSATTLSSSESIKAYVDASGGVAGISTSANATAITIAADETVTHAEMATFSKLLQNPDTISANITIASGYSAMAIGPINFTGTVAVNGFLSIV